MNEWMKVKLKQVKKEIMKEKRNEDRKKEKKEISLNNSNSMSTHQEISYV